MSQKGDRAKELTEQLRMTNLMKQVKRLIGFVCVFKNLVSILRHHLVQFTRFLPKCNSFTKTEDNHKSTNRSKHGSKRVGNLIERSTYLSAVAWCFFYFNSLGLEDWRFQFFYEEKLRATLLFSLFYALIS